MKLLDTSEISKETGIPASALRYYDENGLITSVGRRGLKRLFGPETIDQLAIISLGKLAGLSLEEIRSMFGADGKPSLSRQLLHAKADEIDLQIRKLQSLKEAIRHVAECPAPNHMECPKFQKLLRIGSNKRARTESAKQNRKREYRKD